jgi:deferrochelatase/peroxidase EfeB
MLTFQNHVGLDSPEKISDIQGNILFAYRRARSLLLFVRFGDDVATNRTWIQKYVLRGADLEVSSADIKPDIGCNLVNFFVTASGVAKLGGAGNFDPAFGLGSRHKETIGKLNDKPLEQWHAKYVKRWDAAVLVACTVANLASVRTALLAAARDGRQDLDWHLEQGCVLDENGKFRTDATAEQPSYEAFGYKDGISRSYFTEEDPKPRPGTGPWGSRRPPDMVLAPDPLSPSGGYGSYFAFRKLKQDKAGFDLHVQTVVEQLLEPRGAGTVGRFLFDLYGQGDAFAIFAGSPTRDEVVRFVKGRIMGRHPDGTPVGHISQSAEDNSFDYAQDRVGLSCPFHAHIRAMNARGGREGADEEQRNEIVRRSWAYVEGQEVNGSSDAGLLFLCAQHSISKQFERLQCLANGTAPNLDSEPLHGPDYLVAQASPVTDHLAYADDLDRFQRYARTIDVNVRASRFIELQGAEYLFAPSLSGLRALAGGAS